MRIQQLWMVSLLLVACAAEVAPDIEPRVLLEGEPDPDELEERKSQRQERMNIKITEDGVEKTVDVNAFWIITLHHCSWVVLARGTDEASGAVYPPPQGLCTTFETVDFNNVAGCGKAVCAIEFNMCMAQRMMEFATTTGTASADYYSHTLQRYVDVEVPPQDAEAKIALAQAAYGFATNATWIAGTNLQNITSIRPGYSPQVSAYLHCSSASTDLSTTIGQLWSTFDATTVPNVSRPDLAGSQQTIGEGLATGLVEGTRVATEAADLATEQNLGVADAEFSRTRDTATASQLAWTDVTMSRAAAAHLNVGTGEGLHYFWGQGICPIPDLSTGAESALQLFRRSAIDPRVVQSDLDITAIIEGTNNTPTESLRTRLADRTPDATLRTLDATAFASHFDLTVEDFGRAREYLRHEIRAFGRDITVTLPASPVGRTGGGATIFTSTPNYAATALDPTGAPDQYYVGITRFASPWTESNGMIDDRVSKYRTCTTANDCQLWETCVAGMFPSGTSGSFCQHLPTQSVTPPPTAYGARSVSHLMDYAASIAHDVSPRAANFTGSLPSGVADLLAGFGLEARKQAPKRVETCYRALTGTNPDVFRIRVLGEVDPARIRIVRGISGLRCAETGTIEGVACNLGDHAYTATGTKVTLTSTQRIVGFAEYSEFSLTVDLAATPVEWLYVVEQKDGFAPGQAGSYRGIAAHKPERMRVTNPSTTNNANMAPVPTTSTTADVWAYCSLAPVVPERSRKAAEILAPSPANCGAPKNNCVGFDFADRLPLENEITEDGFEPESSWRHYLDEAIAAANYADELGQDLVNHGFEIDKAIETAQAELETVCGTPVSLRELAWGSMEDARAGTCTSTSNCLTGYECFNGQCVTSVDEVLENQGANNASAQALLLCVGEGTVANYVAAGSDILCAWKATAGSAKLCEAPAGSTTTLTCPFAKLEGVSCAESIRQGNVVGVEPIEIDQTLDLFDKIPPADQQELLENAQPINCGILEVVRNVAGDETLIQMLIEQLQLTLPNVQTVAQRIGWQGYPDDYSAITLDEQPYRTTGEPAITGSLPVFTVNKWPCGARDPSVPDYRNQGACLVDMNRPMVENCVTNCGDNAAAARDARVRMNHQMARAVLALKLAAGVPLSNVQAPFLPDSVSYVWMFDQEEEACASGGSCDFEHFRWTFDTQGVSPIWGGRELRSTDGMTFHVWESNNENEDRDFKQMGDAYCHHTSSTTAIWTDIRPDNTTAPYAPPCANEGVRTRNDGSATAVLFRPLEDVSSDAASAARIWAGMHTSNPPDDGTDHVLEGLVLKLLRGVVPESSVVFSRDTTQIDNDEAFTLYFHHCYGSGSREHYCYRKHPDEVEFNRIPIPADGVGLTGTDLLNGLQLLCDVGKEESFSCRDIAVPAPGSNLQDLRFAQRALECVGQQIENTAALTVLQNVPADVLPENVSETTYAGTRGAELSTLIGSFNRLISAQHNVGSELKDLADDVDILQSALRRTGIAKKIAQLNTESEALDRGLACITATLGAAAGATSIAPSDGSAIFNPIGAILGGGSAAATCINSFQQISLAYERLNLEEEDLELQNGMTWANFRQQFRGHADTLEDMKLAIDTELAALQGALGAIESQRIAAQRHLGQALMATADATGRTFATNAVMRARYNTTRIRYDEALKYAKKMAYMARRALEQRVGIDLMDIDEDLAFVESPRTWVEEVCTFEGVNYQEIATGNAEDYSKTFIGDYVRRLERVKESYDIDFPFTEGTDTAVISMRDDISMARAMCSSSVNNLLAHSAELTAPEWQLVGCNPVGTLPACNDTVDANGNVIYDQSACGSGVPYTRACGFTTEMANLLAVPSTMPIPYVHQDGSAVQGYQVTFGKRESGSSLTSLNPGVTAIAQDVSLPSGIYRLSWRAPDVAPYDGKDAVQVKQTNVNEISDGMGNVTETITVVDAQATAKHTMTVGQGWPIHYLFFQLPLAKDPVPVRVQIASQSGNTLEHGLQIAAFMLEDVTGQVAWSDVQALNPLYEPAGYIATTEVGAAMLPVCEDTTGDNFRQGWTHGCVSLCPGGYETCKVGERQCYFEKAFNLTLEDVERESVLSHAGFAYGNYNYRIEGFALNFVGTGTRDCGSSSFPSTCFASGYFPISVYHDGPYDVRNHLGDKYEASLFRGVVEHARGLAAERYITNPVSSADEQLISSYVRYEMAGRPLAGRFTVRVWEQEGVNFNAVEDIQILLKYRYWTRAQ